MSRNTEREREACRHILHTTDTIPMSCLLSRVNRDVQPLIGATERFPLSVLIYLRLNAGRWEGFSKGNRNTAL